MLNSGIPLKGFILKCSGFWDAASFHVRGWAQKWVWAFRPRSTQVGLCDSSLGVRSSITQGVCVATDGGIASPALPTLGKGQDHWTAVTPSLRSQPPGYLASGIGGDHRRRTVRAVCTWTGGKEDAASRPALGVRVLWPLVHYLLLCLPEGHGWAQVSLILQIFPFTVSPYSRSFLLLLLMMTLLEGSSPHPNTRIRGSLWPLQSPQPHEQHLAYCRGSVSIYRVIKWRNESTEVILLTSASTHSEACCLKLSPNALTLPYSIALTFCLANCELFLTRLFLFFSTPCDPIVYLQILKNLLFL